MSTPCAETAAFLERLRTAVEALPDVDWTSSRAVVAFSGGLDSTVLLHALTRLDTPARVSAFHVDHGIHADSAQWSAHCEALARQLGVPFATERVDVRRDGGDGLEAAARAGRYAAFAAHLRPDDVLLTAHHGDDQLETLLLRLLRGSGVRGLAGIHAFGTLGRARFARPLLDFSRAEIAAYAIANELEWLDDPSNADLALDRNYLRAAVLPALAARWPAAHRAAARLARQMADTEDLLTELAAADLGAVETFARLPAGHLLGLGRARRRNALRYAIRSLRLPVPAERQLAELEARLATRADAETCVRWPGAEARLYRGTLYLMASLAEPDVTAGARLRPDAPWDGRSGRLELVAANGYGIPDEWVQAGLEIRFRAGGERIRPAGRAHRCSLKHWFQENGIVPWMRARVPLLYHEDMLVAVADLCLAADLPASSAGPRWRLRWTAHAPVR